MAAARRSLLAAVAAAVTLSGCSVQHPAGPQPSPGTVSEHVRVLRSPGGATTVLLPVTVNGHGPYTFALDTGASTSLVSSAVAAQAGLRQVGRPQAIQGVGGVETAIPVRPTSWSTGPIKLPVLTISSAQLPSSRRTGGLQGLMGSDVWSRLGRFTLDYRTETLTVPT